MWFAPFAASPMMFRLSSEEPRAMLRINNTGRDEVPPPPQSSSVAAHVMHACAGMTYAILRIEGLHR